MAGGSSHHPRPPPTIASVQPTNYSRRMTVTTLP